MKSKKGFTLLELLAVIVVLAIIALIVTPFVTNAIKEAREGAAKNSAYGIISAAELYYAEQMAANAGYFDAVTFTWAEDGTLSSTPTGKTFTFKGDKPKSGSITIDSNGVVTIGSAGLVFGNVTVNATDVGVSVTPTTPAS